MEIDFQWHPSEFLRKCRVAWQEFWNDQDFRHPELRHRLALELTFRAEQAQMNESDRSHIHPIIEEFDRSHERVPFIEFWILMEWNERFMLASTWVDLQLMKRLWEDSSDSLKTPILHRLKEIQTGLLRLDEATDPGWMKLLHIRWRNAALRDELRYFRSLPR